MSINLRVRINMKITIIGSGAWGTSLAIVAYRAGNEVNIYSRNKDTCAEINQNHSNSSYLANIALPNEIKASANLAIALEANILLLASPAQTIRQICTDLAYLKLSPETTLVICAKGIEQESLKLMSEVVAEILPSNPVSILSGPNFAHEIAQDLPAITSIASLDRKLAIDLSKIFSGDNFRAYPNEDIIGTQIIGAAKNVLAIATGICMGKKLGENAKAAILSRGIVEINQLIIAKGGRTQTLLSPAGIGDINLTCSSATSRNTSYGIALAEGTPTTNNILVEGVYTAKSISMLANSINVEMPICTAIYQVTHQNHPIDEAIKKLLNRPIKPL